LGSCLLHLPTIWQCGRGPAVAAASWDFPKITLGSKRPVQRGKAKRDEALSPKVHYTKHNVLDEAIPSFAGCPPLGLCYALGSKRAVCICFMLVPSRWVCAWIFDGILWIESSMPDVWSKLHRLSTSKWLCPARQVVATPLAIWSKAK
jgi:hypothetical protein